MDLDQNALSPTALAWDRNGELRFQEFRCLLVRLRAQEVNSKHPDATERRRR